MATDATTTSGAEETSSVTAPAPEPTQTSDGTQTTDTPKLTQADIDAAIKERLARAEKKHAEELSSLKSSLEQTSAALKSFQEKEAEIVREKDEREKEKLREKGEFEKILEIERKQASDALKAKETLIAQLEAKNRDYQDRYTKTKIDTELLRLVSADAVDPADAVALLKTQYTFSLDDASGEPVVASDPALPLAEVVKQFLDAKPHLTKSAFTGSTGGGSRATATTVAGAPVFTRAQINDPTFYKEHRMEIIDAIKAGRVK